MSICGLQESFLKLQIKMLITNGNIKWLQTAPEASRSQIDLKICFLSLALACNPSEVGAQADSAYSV